MTDKAQIERLTELSRLAAGQSTKRTPAEILTAEKSAAGKYIPKPKQAAPAPETPSE